MTRKRRIIAWVLSVAGVAAAVVVVWLVLTVVRVTRTMLEAEDRLHASILVCDVVGDHLEANGYTQWPRSWDELAATPPREWSRFNWPDDIGELRGFVVVDFGAELDDVAATTPATFTAVQPNGVCYEVWRGHAAATLLDLIRSGLRDTAGPSSPGSE